MKKHNTFIRGIIAGGAIVAIVDLLFVHLLFGSHRMYNSSSVNIVEPLIILIAIIGLVYLTNYEFNSRLK